MKWVLTPSFLLYQVTILRSVHPGRFFMPFFLILITAILGSTTLYAQQDSTDNPQTDSLSAPDGTDPMNLPPPGGSCIISGTSPAIAGNIYTYTLSCDDGSVADYWGASCGTVVSMTTTQVSIKWNSSGCSSGTVYAYDVTDVVKASKAVTINPPPPPTITYSPLYTSSTFTKTIDLTKPVGTVPGAAGTTPTGGVTYSIPIYAPPGTNGVQPAISISYNSQAGPGVVGFGWNIGGLSVISRTGKNIYHNGIAAPVKYTTDDAFLLDGMRLNVISGSNGANGTVYAGEAESFARITSYATASANNPDWFLVTAKDGSKMEFGRTADSRVKTDDNANVMLWRLNRILDVAGNYVDFVYEIVDRESRIKTIKYTGNINTALAASNSISFEYALKTDQSTGYDAGGSLASKYLLTKITVIADDDIFVKRYTFNYGFDNVNSLLKEVVENGSDGTSLNSTIFLYGDQPDNFSYLSTNMLSTANHYISGDFNADGKTDLLEAETYLDENINTRLYTRYTAITSIDEGSCSVLYQRDLSQNNTSVHLRDKNIFNFLTSDYNGDSRDDVVEVNSSTELIHCDQERRRKISNIIINFTGSFNSQTGLTDYHPLSYMPPVDALNNTYEYVSQKGQFFIPGDFDGDGNQDYILILGKKRSTGWCSLAYQTYTFDYKGYMTSPSTSEKNLEIANFGFGANPDPNYYAGTIANADFINTLDFDGDGKTELLVTKDGLSYILSVQRVSVTTGYYFACTVLYSTSEITKDSKVFTGDFNADRKGDVLVRSSNGTWKTLYSTGLSFTSSPFSFNQTPSLTGSDYDDKIITADFNGDGRTDILHAYYVSPNGKYSFYFSRGNSFFYEQYTHIHTLSVHGYATGDFNGDGRTDLLTIVNDYTADFISIKPLGKERLLAKVTDGQNNTTSFGYKNLTDKSVYPYFYDRTVSLDDAANKNPYNYVQLPMHAVSSVSAPNGIGGTNTTTFNYENAVVHRAAKGFLGFKKITAQDAATGVTSVTENEINTQFAIPYTVKQTTSLTATSEVLSQTLINTSFTNLSTGFADIRYFQKTDKVFTTNNLAGSATESVNTYDSYGNITTNVTKKGSFSGTTVTPRETTTTTTAFGIHNTPVPAKPDAVTVLNKRDALAAQGSTTRFTYTTNGQVFTQVAFDGLPKAVTTTNTYNLVGNLTQAVTSAAGLGSRTAKFIYDVKGTFVTKRETIGTGVSQSESYTYDYRWGKPTSQISSDCLTTTFEYDGYGRIKKTNVPEGYSLLTTLAWDVQGNSVYYASTDYPGGSPDTKIWYDKLGRPVKQSTAGFNSQWRTQLTTYDAKGNVATQTNEHYTTETPLTTTNTYDAYNRLTKAANTLNTTTYTYTKVSGGKLQVKTTNSGGQSSSKIADPTGKIVTAIDNGGQLNISYDSWGNQTSISHGSTALVTNTYDAYGRQVTLADKNAGTVTYEYDAYGQLKKQTDANGNIYTMAYDDLGRITSRQGPEGTTIYEYYKNTTTGCSNNNLAKVTGFNNVIKEYLYNSLQRMQSEKVTVDGVAYTTQFEYDTYGSLTKTTYPSGIVVVNGYDGNGGLLTVSGGNAAAPATLFTATAVNGFGQYTGYTLGNGKASQTTYHYGTPTRFYTAGIQDLNLTFDYTKGNLTSRRDAIKNITEGFTYDNLNRLTGTTVNSVQQLSMAYDGTTSSSLGNITNKTDAGAYTYKTDKINAVAYITNPAGPTADPVTISKAEQQISYTPFLKTATITEGNYNLSYTYGPEYQRVKSVLKQGTTTLETRYYLGSYEKQVGGTTREIHYVSGGNGLCAMIVKEGSTVNIYYVYTDHLGSLVTVTNSTGTVVAEQNFDAWGRNRNAVTWQYTAGAATPAWLYRGYTGHELAPHFALINMNGRMYDPVQGRMLSPDNYVSTPFGTQGYNRYAYAMNNPLSFTDPSGDVVWFVPIIIGAAVGAFMGGIQADMQGKSFLSGAWKGAIVGAVGGGLSLIGGGAFIANVAWGAGQGVFTNGLSNILNGNHFFQGAGLAALTGAAFAAISSDNMKNMFKGQGFRSNSKVLQSFVDNGEYQAALDYFKMDAQFSPDGLTGDGSMYEGSFTPRTKEITLTKYAFSIGDKVSFDKLNSVYQKELWHKARWLSGNWYTDIGDNWPASYKYPYAAEDALGHAFMQKNAGAFPGAFSANPTFAERQFRHFIGNSSNFSRNFLKIWEWQGVTNSLYQIPRRFRTILDYVPRTY
jgi:RHS repeat-associated protein